MQNERNLVLIVEFGSVYPDSHRLEGGLVDFWHDNDDLYQIIEDRHPEILDAQDMFQVDVYTGVATSTEGDGLFGTYEYPFPDVVESEYRQVSEESPVVGIKDQVTYPQGTEE